MVLSQVTPRLVPRGNVANSQEKLPSSSTLSPWRTSVASRISEPCLAPGLCPMVRKDSRSLPNCGLGKLRPCEGWKAATLWRSPDGSRRCHVTCETLPLGPGDSRWHGSSTVSPRRPRTSGGMLTRPFWAPGERAEREVGAGEDPDLQQGGAPLRGPHGKTLCSAFRKLRFQKG